jgi:sodium transport system permease protein
MRRAPRRRSARRPSGAPPVARAPSPPRRLRSAHSITWLVLRAELLGLLRDRRAVAAAVLLPVVLYPLLFYANSWLRRVSRESMAARSVVVGLDLDAAPEELAAPLRLLLQQRPPIDLVDVDADSLWAGEPADTDGRWEVTDEELRAARRILAEQCDALVAALPLPEGQGVTFRLHHDGTEDVSIEARRRVRSALDELERSAAEGLRKRVLGASDPGRGLDVELVDVASPQATRGAALGRMLPLLSVLVVLSGGAFGALSAFAGERESRTLESLLVQPVPSAALAWGKFGAVLLLALAALVSNAGSLVVSVALGLGTLPGMELDASGAQASLAPDLAPLLLGAFAFLPAVVFLCALLCLVSARAQSYREGQHLLLPLTIAASLPAAVAGFGDVDLGGLAAIVPLLGQGLALRDALLGQLLPLPGAIAFASGTLWSWLALRKVAQLLDAERVLATEAHERELELRATQSRTAIAWGFAAVMLIYLVGGRLQAWRTVPGLLLTLLALAPAVALASARGTAKRARVRIAEVLSLRPAHFMHLAGALLLAPGFAVLMHWWIPLQQRLLPMPAGMQSEAGPLKELMELSPFLLALALGVAPAIGEELLFRGAIQGGLSRDLPRKQVALWQALFFGLAHASVFRFVPTAVVGASLSLIVARAGSLYPAILLHAAYNSLLVLSDHWPALENPHLGWLGLLGLVLLIRAPSRPAKR